eukprot:TRINITY_DN256_c0_g2_i1.p1 TRINITY_DN256_c0_g2~~TRINITY_DN256_c0_g2_i1.p1  ORF type:complete len:467 (+),score=138.55 TRINITY_DN256_c0_g2_i1:42-1403(+)
MGIIVMTMRRISAAVALLLCLAAFARAQAGIGAQAGEDECVSQTISREDQDQIVHTINTLRDRTARGLEGKAEGADIRELRWDGNLTKSAESFAKKCKVGQSRPADRIASIRRANVKEIELVVTSTRPLDHIKWADVIDHWASGVKDVTPGIIDKYAVKGNDVNAFRAYSQLIWGHTEMIGCATSRFKTGDRFRQIFVCHFAKGGLDLNEAVYQSGKACTKCPTDYECSKRYTGLCWYDPNKVREVKPVCKEGKLRDADRQGILNFLNEIRANLANGKIDNVPSAANMKQLEWDEELERSAQTWAGQCSFKKSQNNNKLSEVIFGKGSLQPFEEAMWLDAVKEWALGAKFVPVALFEKYGPVTERKEAVESYAQLIWAKTGRVGCGFANQEETYKGSNKNAPPRKVYKQMVVCHFSERGNIVGEPIFIKGRACSTCPDGFSCSKSTPGLCRRS